MPPKSKSLTEEEVKQIRSSSNYREIAESLGIGKNRAKAIKEASTLEEAMKIASPRPKASRGTEEKVSEVLTEASIKPEPKHPAETPKPQETKPPSETKPEPENPPQPELAVPIQPQPRENGYRALIPEEIVGKGIPFKITLSVRTVAYYQIASSIDHNLELDNFLDHCVHDTFEGRGLTLGLIRNKTGG